MSSHPHARHDHPRRRARRFSPRTAVSALALAIGLSACAGGSATPPAAANKDKAAMLLKIADETDAGGDPATAASLYRQLHELSPKDPVPLARLAAIFMSMQDYRAAAEAYRAALTLDGNNPDLHRGLGAALLVAGDAEAAMVEVRTALEKRADDSRLYNLLGVAQDMVGRHDLAQQSYRHGSDMAPANAGLRNNYAMSLALSGDFGEAVAKLGELAGPDAAPRYRLNLALAYGLAGDDAKAAATARQVLDEASVQNNLAYYALLRGMDEKSRTAAIIGAELRGTAVTADAAVKPRSDAMAEAKPVAAPAPAPVAAAALPPLLPEAAAPPAETSSRPASAPRHVAALADHPAPTKERAAAAASPDAAPMPDLPPHDGAAPAEHPAAAAKEPASDAASSTPAILSPNGVASARAMPETASAPPISLVAPQQSPSPEPAVAPAPQDQPPPPLPLDAAGKTVAVPAPSSPPPSTPAQPDAALAGPTAAPALDEKIVAPSAAPTAEDKPPAPDAAGQTVAAPAPSNPPSPAQAQPDASAAKPSADTALDPAVAVPSTAAPLSADADFAARVNAWLDMRAVALSLAPKAETAVAQPSETLGSAVERYTVQLGSFIYEASAHRIADAFAAKGVVVTISRSNDHVGREWYVARSGEFATFDDATGVLHMIQSMGGPESIVVRHRLPGEPSPAI